MHAHVAAAVAEGKYRLASDLFHDRLDLVHFQVLDHQPVRPDNIILACVYVLQPVSTVFVCCLNIHIHTDNLLIRNIQIAFDKRPAKEPVASAADIDFELILLQVFHNLDHGQVECIRVGHSFESVCFTHQLPRDKILELRQRHAGIRPGRMFAVKHVHTVRE